MALMMMETQLHWEDPKIHLDNHIKKNKAIKTPSYLFLMIKTCFYKQGHQKLWAKKFNNSNMPIVNYLIL